MPKLVNVYENPKLKKYLKSYGGNSEQNTGIKTPFRMLVVAASGGFKTTFFLNYLNLVPNTFSKLIICNKAIEEPIYDYLKDELKGNVLFYTLKNMPDMKTLCKDKEDDEQYLVIFDDVVCDLPKDGHPTINSFFIAGRKYGISMMFLSQSYFKVNTLIRQNLSHLILLKLSGKRDLSMILSDYTLSVSQKTLKEMYKDATSEECQPLIVDITTNNIKKKFSKGFLDFYDVEEEEEE